MTKILNHLLENKNLLKNYDCNFNIERLNSEEEAKNFLREKRENEESNCEYLSRKGFFDKISKDIASPLIFDGKIQPVFNYEECIFEKVYVETSLDTDKDGKRDLIAVFVRRPKETLMGMKVPAIYVANPYMMKCIEEVYENRLYDVDKNLDDRIENIQNENTNLNKIIPPAREVKGEAKTSLTEEIELDCISEWYKYFNSRGVASVFSAGVGTDDSEGINCTGSNDEKQWVISVIEWLNGKRKAFTDKENNIEIKADWCTGKVAMSGKSYLGTLCIGAAVTGVEGLATIIPEAAISSWYNYYRMNGVTASPLGWQGDDADLLTDYCRSRKITDENQLRLADEISENMRKASDRLNGNYNEYWKERDYLLDASKIKASVFIVHGLNDWNVKTNQCYNFWRELKKYNIPSKMILHQGEHIYIDRLKGIDFNNIMNMWISHWLFDVENDVMNRVPEILVQSNLEQEKWLEVKEKNEKKIYTINRERNLILNSENIELSENIKELKDDIKGLGFDREIKNYDFWQKELILGAGERKERAIYLGEILKEDIRISGEINVCLNIVPKQSKGLISVMLVDYGKEKRLNANQKFLEDETIILGRGTEKITKFIFEKDENISDYKIISRGHMNLQNLKGKDKKERLVSNSEYEYVIDMIPTHYIIPKNHRLGLIIYGTDTEITQRPLEIMEYLIKENSIKLIINED